MKKYLKDLEAELKKLKISDEEIKEILEDHKEMLTEATNEGLTDEELASKFGDPEKLAKELFKDVLDEKVTSKTESVFGTESLKEYELMHSFQIVDTLKHVNISLVSEDVIYFSNEGETIEVYVKGHYDQNDYEINYSDGVFNLLKSKESKGFRIFGKKTPDFGIIVPASELEMFKLNMVSGDAELEDVRSNEIELRMVSGDIEAKNVVTNSDLKVSVVSGDIELMSVYAKGLEATMVSGDMEITKGSFDEELHINTVSGDVDAKDIKVSNIDFHSVSGDFSGEEVYCNTVELKSVSGDLRIRNANTDHKIDVIKKNSLSGKVTIK